MNALASLINAAAVKGYLKAAGADAEVIGWADAIVEQELARVSERVRNEDVKLPENDSPALEDDNPYAWNGKTKRRDDAVLQLSDLPQIEAHLAVKSIRQVAKLYGVSHTGLRDFLKRVVKPQPENAIVAPEMAHGEENEPIPAMAGAESGEEAPVTTAEALRAPRRTSPLEGKLDEIKEFLSTESFGVVGHRYGVSGETIKNFLKRNGVDTAQYRKSGGNPNFTARMVTPVSVEDDVWPEAVKPEKTMSLSPVVSPPAEQPKSKFKMVQGKNSWGGETEYQVAEPVERYRDPATGAKVTKYPPGYAVGVSPQRNLTVKGGG